MTTTKKEKKGFSLPKLKFFWRKSERPSNSDTILINGKLVVFIACSLISCFINLVFISNLTKSNYDIGTLLSVPAAVLLGFMSIGLDLSKTLHCIQVNTLNELYRKLNNHAWSKRIKNVSRKWSFMYVLYVALSIITSVSLSTISIGAGITRNANTLKQIDEFIAQGETYSNIDSTSKNIVTQNLIRTATDNTEQNAIDFTRDQMAKIRPLVESYKAERAEFEAQFPDGKIDWNSTWNGKNASVYWDAKNTEVNSALQNAGYGRVSGTGIKTLNLNKVETTIRTNRITNTTQASTDKAVEKLSELSSSTMDEALGWLETLNNIGLTNPKTGEIVVFDTNKDKQAKVLISSALTQLKALRVDIENDSGDIGSSSKIFMQLGSTIDNMKSKKSSANTDLTEALNPETDGSFGSTEVMMMLMLLFLSLLCEIAINQFSPKTNISRKMMSQFSQYFPPDFNLNDFMLDVYIEQYNYGSMTKAQFDSAVKETLEMMEITKESLIARIKEKEEAKKNRAKALKTEVPEVKLPEVPVSPELPAVDVHVEETNTIPDEQKTSPVEAEVSAPEVKKESKPRVRKIVKEAKAEKSENIDNDEINSLLADCEDIIND